MAESKGVNLNWIDDLKARADICTVISSYVPLEKKGQKYWACCPFHAERTPSFAVDAIRGSWYCFGACHEGGDVISFEMKINNIDFQEAVKRLAGRVGMKLPETFNFEKHDKVTDREYTLMLEAARYYRDNLAKKPEVEEYLKSRHLTKQTINQFGLGCSLDYNSLVEHLTHKGYSRKEMLDLGLLGEHDGRYFDFLAERMVVPIFDPMITATVLPIFISPELTSPTSITVTADELWIATVIIQPIRSPLKRFFVILFIIRSILLPAMRSRLCDI